MNDRIRAAYDQIAEAYAANRDQLRGDVYLRRFAGLLPPGGKVLDVGCGSGVPVARYLVERGFDVTGIDISARQIELARRNVPEARFEVADMQELKEDEFQVDGIIALYSVFHVDRRIHGRLLHTFRTFLPRGGALLVTMGASDWEGSEADFFGTEMMWSHYGPARNRELIEAAGFTVMLDEIDASGGDEHQVVLANA